MTSLDAGLIVKCADGETWWPQFDQLAATRPKGGRLAAWAYAYPETARDTALLLLRAHGRVEFLVVDAEAEFEVANGADQARALVETLAPARGSWGITSFAFPSLHPLFPWSVFLGAAAFWQPQVYWQLFDMDPATALQRAVREASPWRRPLFPLGQAFGNVTPTSVRAFARAAWASGCPGVAWWELGQAPRSILATISKTGPLS